MARLITFSGVDGSGKTTLAFFAAYWLERYGATALVHNDGSIGRHLTMRTRKTRWTYCHAWIVGVKDLLVQNFRFLRLCLRNRFIVSDRFIDDTIIKLRYRHGELSTVTRILSALSPRPVVRFIITLPPGVSFARDHEHSAEYHLKKGILYEARMRELATSGTPSIMLDGSKPIEELKGQIIKHLSLMAPRA